MTRHVTVLAWELAGAPEPVAPEMFRPGAAVCVMCGRDVDRSAAAAKAIGANFTDQYLYRRPDSDRICWPCVWVCSGKPPATLRMWSVVAAPGADLPPSQPKAWLQGTPGLCLANRADTRPVAGMLAAPPAGAWVVSVAVSGQKHVLPYARVNHGPGPWTVRMENTDITASPGVWRDVLGRAAALRLLGHSAQAITDGVPDLARIKTPDELGAWRAHAAVLAPYVRSPLLELALWCCTKNTTEEYARDHINLTDAPGPGPGPGAGGPDGLDRPVPGLAPQLGLF